MAPPIYFLPGVSAAQLRPRNTLNPELMAAARLGRVFADVSPMRLTLSNLHCPGPGDQAGVIFRAEATSGPPAPRFDYLPESQEWDRVIHQGQVLYWIGRDKLAPPRPADLQRTKPLKGHLVQLADGQYWQVPLIRRPNPSGGPPVSGLPTEIRFDGDGRSANAIRAEYLDIWDRSARVFDVAWLSAPLEPGEEVDLNRFALDALALNYRIGFAEANVLGLFGDADAAVAVVEAAIGKQFMDEWQKKSAGAVAGVTSGPGP